MGKLEWKQDPFELLNSGERSARAMNGNGFNQFRKSRSSRGADRVSLANTAISSHHRRFVAAISQNRVGVGGCFKIEPI